MPVAHAPGQNSRTVAQFVFVMVGALTRRLIEGDKLVKQGRYLEARKKLSTHTLYEFGEKNLAVLGIGRIGREVARIGNFLGYHVGYYDAERLDPKIENDMNVTYYDLSEILKWADITTLHIPLNPLTLSFIGENEFKLMKPTAILIDISRGGIVNEDALCSALTEGQIWGAGIDVFTEEPPPVSHPYLNLPDDIKDRMILSPHMGGRTYESNQRMFSFAIENVRAFLVDGKPLQCVVNSDKLFKGDLK